MESVNFTSFIHSLIKDVMNNEFKTGESLYLMIEKLDKIARYSIQKNLSSFG